MMETTRPKSSAISRRSSSHGRDRSSMESANDSSVAPKRSTRSPSRSAGKQQTRQSQTSNDHSKQRLLELLCSSETSSSAPFVNGSHRTSTTSSKRRPKSCIDTTRSDHDVDEPRRRKSSAGERCHHGTSRPASSPCRSVVRPTSSPCRPLSRPTSSPYRVLSRSAESNALYLASLAKIYDVSQMRRLKQLQYKTLLLQQQHLGFHSYNKYDSYSSYLSGPRTKEFDKHNRQVIRQMEDRGSVKKTRFFLAEEDRHSNGHRVHEGSRQDRNGRKQHTKKKTQLRTEVQSDTDKETDTTLNSVVENENSATNNDKKIVDNRQHSSAAADMPEWESEDKNDSGTDRHSSASKKSYDSEKVAHRRKCKHKSSKSEESDKNKDTRESVESSDKICLEMKTVNATSEGQDKNVTDTEDNTKHTTNEDSQELEPDNKHSMHNDDDRKHRTNEENQDLESDNKHSTYNEDDRKHRTKEDNRELSAVSKHSDTEEQHGVDTNKRDTDVKEAESDVRNSNNKLPQCDDTRHSADKPQTTTINKQQTDNKRTSVTSDTSSSYTSSDSDTSDSSDETQTQNSDSDTSDDTSDDDSDDDDSDDSESSSGDSTDKER